MIIKGQAFTFMYETRNKSTGELVADSSATHTITVYYIGNSGWTSATVATAAPSQYTSGASLSSPKFIGTEAGLYLLQLTSQYTNCDHIIVSITSSNANVIVPLQQFYPVDLSQFSSSGNGASAASVAEYVWHYGEANFGGSTTGVTATRALPSSERNAIADTLLDRSASGHTTSQTLGSLINTGISSGGGGGGTYYVDTSSLQTQVGLLTSQVSSLTTIQNNMSSLLSSNGSLYTLMDSLDDKLDDLDDLTDANTLAAAVWDYAEDHTANIACLNDIAENVWTYSGTRALTTNTLDTIGSPVLMLNSDAHLGSIATKVWSNTTRKLTSRQVGESQDYIAKTGDFTVSITDENFSVDLPDADDIASAVWTGGYDRTLTSPNIGNNTALATTAETTALATAINNIPTNVWSDQTAATRSLTTESIGSGKALATASDTSDVSDLIDAMMTTLSKIYGVLCHWKVDGNNIIVYDDDNETLLTIPTIKNKYGDILQMGEMPEEDS